MAIGLKVKRNEELPKAEQVPPLNPAWPWRVASFPFSIAGVVSEHPKKVQFIDREQADNANRQAGTPVPPSTPSVPTPG